ncbi:MAG TPA: histidine triad nucleotide-binding protein [Candidatus Polarisedimenticolia bacterium]|nr:histidine triad nucleotide-binding protein [Candidatus Polarisedimenticolia bacterium]
MSDCLFCRIARKEIPAKIAYEDDQVLAFEDISPQAPTHTLVISKKHLATLNDVTGADEPLLGHMVRTASQIARDKGLADAGFRLVANCMEGAGQSVFHLHIHLLGGRRFAWPPG